MLDYLIKGATVVDGTGRPGEICDVGIHEGKIVMNPAAETVAEIIDAAGLHLTPGFIDAHSHGDCILGRDYAKKCKISQGITTEITGQCGSSLFPVNEEHAEDIKGIVASLTDTFPPEYNDYTDFEKYSGYVDKTPIAANVKTLVGHGSLRVSVMGYANRPSTEEELGKMKAILREAMEHGALGMSSGLIYTPSCYTDIHELIELGKVIAEYGGVYETHMRNESFDVVNSVKEALTVGKESGCAGEISHHKICGRPNWGLSQVTLGLVEEAKAQGQVVTLDQYPYLASMTNMNAVIPPVYFDKGVPGVAEKAKDPEMRRRIKEDILNPGTPFENQYINCGGWDNIMISTLVDTPEYNGMTITEAAEARHQDPFDAYFDLLAANRGTGVFIYFSMCDEDLCRIFMYPDTVVGTDGICRAMVEKAHPRAWGSFPQAIQHFHKEKRLLTFEEIIHKCTQLPAERAMIPNKGVIRNGWDADLLLIDYETLEDKATYQESNVVCDGMEYVFVNGKIVYHDKKMTGENPGRLLRHCGRR